MSLSFNHFDLIIPLSCALAMWIYSTCDNVDGKQARRTGSSSPLGELFDHGCDALDCSVIFSSFTLTCGSVTLRLMIMCQ